MEKLTQKQIWDKIASDWNIYRQKPVPEVIEFLKDKTGRILDLGCGSGRHLTNDLNLVFYETDFSEQMINYAKQNAEKKKIKAEFIVADSINLPFENNFFDSAIYIAALHCIEQPVFREKSLKELFRVLKLDSQALITVWSKNHIKLINHPKDATISWKKQSEELQRYYYLYDKEELQQLLEKIGFKILEITEDNKNIATIVKK